MENLRFLEQLTRARTAKQFKNWMNKNIFRAQENKCYVAHEKDLFR